MTHVTLLAIRPSLCHSPITTHQSPLANHHSPITTHQSPLTNHHSPITTRQSPLADRRSAIVGASAERQQRSPGKSSSKRIHQVVQSALIRLCRCAIGILCSSALFKQSVENQSVRMEAYVCMCVGRCVYAWFIYGRSTLSRYALASGLTRLLYSMFQ